MKRKSIKKVVAWAMRNRPAGYIAELKSRANIWNIEQDFYEISDDDWNGLAVKYGGKKVAAKPDPRNNCQQRSCGNCSEPASCRINGGAACPYGPGEFDKCFHWREMNPAL